MVPLYHLFLVSYIICVNIFFVLLLSLEILYVLALGNLEVIGTYSLFIDPLLRYRSYWRHMESLGLLLWSKENILFVSLEKEKVIEIEMHDMKFIPVFLWLINAHFRTT
jgi:hypothetical protein